ncbi:MAG: phage holin family protein [Ottowia sp.]|nr:phage holin family protein [Ottowia sp.]
MFQTRLALASLELSETRRQLSKLVVVIFLIFLFALSWLATFTAFISVKLQPFLALEDVLLGLTLTYFALTALCAWYIYHVVRYKLRLFKATRTELAKDYDALQQRTAKK